LEAMRLGRPWEVDLKTCASRHVVDAMAEGATLPGVLRKRFGEHVRDLRKARGMSQTELAVALDWSTSRLSKLENGHIPVELDDVQQVGLALSVDYATLLGPVLFKPATSAEEYTAMMPGLARQVVGAAVGLEVIAFQGAMRREAARAVVSMLATLGDDDLLKLRDVIAALVYHAQRGKPSPHFPSPAEGFAVTSANPTAEGNRDGAKKATQASQRRRQRQA
jgi:transcriptional regulator with XRE-family HTH domain